MPNGNGGLIGVANVPTSSGASGMWSLNEARRHKAAGNWPKQRASAVYADATVLGTDLTTYTFTGRAIGTAEADRRVVVAVTSAKNDSVTPSTCSVTIAGVTATQLGFVNAIDGAAERCIGLYIADVPTGTTGDIVATFSLGQVRCSVGIWATYGVRSATPVDMDTSSAGTPASVTLDVAEDGIVIAAWQPNGSAGARTTTWTNATERYDTTLEGFTTHSGADATTPSPGTLTITATASAAVVASINPAIFISLR